MIIMGDTVVDEYGHEDLDHFSPGFLVGCYFDDLEKKSIPWHWHVEMETGIVMEGMVMLHTPKQEWKLQKGDGFLINSGMLQETMQVVLEKISINKYSQLPMQLELMVLQSARWCGNRNRSLSYHHRCSRNKRKQSACVV